MISWGVLGILVLLLVAGPGEACASGGHHGGGCSVPGAVGPGPFLWMPIYPYGMTAVGPPPPPPPLPPVPIYVGPAVTVPGPSVRDPMRPEPAGIDPRIDPKAPGPHRPSRPARRVRIDEDRASERVTVGDRLFRAGEHVKAGRRYEEALKANPTLAKGYARLAQVAVAGGKYHEAADHFREAQTADPGWLLFPDDIQNLFGDPEDFEAVVNELESYLRTHPEDRDGWMVLGAELYLSGRQERAGDVFLRLTDGRTDATVEAFLRMTGKSPEEGRGVAEKRRE